MKGITAFLVILMGMMVSCLKSEFKNDLIGDWIEPSEPACTECYSVWTFEKNGDYHIRWATQSEYTGEGKWKIKRKRIGLVLILENKMGEVSTYAIVDLTDTFLNLCNTDGPCDSPTEHLHR